MSDPTSLTLAEARDAVRRKTLSARELTEAHIGAMEAARPLNLFITETADRARAMAEASDARLAKGEAGPLEGLPLGIKDLYCTEGVQHDRRQPYSRAISYRLTNRPITSAACGATAP